LAEGLTAAVGSFAFSASTRIWRGVQFDRGGKDMTNKWALVVLGIWLIVSPFVLNIAGTGRWSNIIVGLIVAVLGYTSTKAATA
jgi:hypothetical protein